MTGPRILTDDQLDKMVELRERGLSCLSIADWFTRNGTIIGDKAIAWQCLRMGAYPPGNSRMRRGTHFGKGRPYTAAEDRVLIEMSQAGARLSAIARAVGRRHNSVTGRLLTLAKYEALDEAA